jgi:hypothetical protein
MYLRETVCRYSAELLLCPLRTTKTLLIRDYPRGKTIAARFVPCLLLLLLLLFNYYYYYHSSKKSLTIIYKLFKFKYSYYYKLSLWTSLVSWAGRFWCRGMFWLRLDGIAKSVAEGH